MTDADLEWLAGLSAEYDAAHRAMLAEPPFSSCGKYLNVEGTERVRVRFDAAEEDWRTALNARGQDLLAEVLRLRPKKPKPCDGHEWEKMEPFGWNRCGKCGG